MDLWKYSKSIKPTFIQSYFYKISKMVYYYWIKHYLPEFKQIAEGKATTMGHIQRGHLANSLLPAPKDFKIMNYLSYITKRDK